MRKKSEKKESSVFLYDDHKLVTRRDFLAAGAIPFAASMFAPTLLSLLLRSNEAHAACPSGEGTGPSLPAFIQFNLAGGAMLGANFIPRRIDGTFAPNMSLMGVGGASALTGNTATEFGVTDGFLSTSGLLAGIRASASAATLANTTIVAIVARGRDDTNVNRLDISGLVTAAGNAGTKLPNLSTSNFQQSPTLLKPPTPLRVTSYDDVRSASGVEGPIGNLGKSFAEATFKLVQRLSESEANRLLSSQVRNAGELKELIGCATSANATLAAQDRPATDPREVAAIANVWGITGGGNPTNPRNESVVFASLVYNALIGQTGPVRLEKGGYDYHNNTRTTGDARDTEAGVICGRILESASALNQPVFLYLSTDGACRSEESASISAPWVSDRGQAGVTLILVYDPSGRPTTAVRSGANLPNQIGYLTNGQAADESFTSGWNDERAGLAVFANYLAWARPSDWRTLYNQVISSNNLTQLLSTTGANNELDRVLRL